MAFVFHIELVAVISKTGVRIIHRHTQALHTYRTNLSPFTKDFRVWGAPIETYPIYLKAALWQLP